MRIETMEDPDRHANDLSARRTAIGFAQVMVDRVVEAGRPITYTFNEIDPVDEICEALQTKSQVTYERLESDQVRVIPYEFKRRNGLSRGSVRVG
jgi:hypothetical protein